MLVHRLNEHIKPYQDVEVVIAPTFIHLQPLSLEIDRRKFSLAAQNAYQKDKGAYTGEISFSMLRNLVKYVIIGHSERRIYFNESLATIRDKVQACIRNGITPILCIGETQQERRGGETRQVLYDQILSAVSNLTSEEIERVIIAYEPVWAISTFQGELAKPSEIKPILDYLRKQIAELYGKKTAEEVKMLYGGSVDDQTVKGYLELEGCDGALVGGASLNYRKFAGIVEVAHALAREEHKG